jgi:hypothetical protein
MSSKDSRFLDVKSRNALPFKVIDEKRPVIAHIRGRVIRSPRLPFIANFGHHREALETGKPAAYA